MSAIALDTNIFLLLVVGRATGGSVGPRLRAYTDEDFGILKSCLLGYDRLIVTPNILTEVSNIWPRGMEGDWLRSVPLALAELIKSGVEIVKPSRDVVDDPEFSRLGLADCVWLAVLDDDATLLTDDVALFNIALSRGLRAVNFTELRQFD